MKKKGFVCLILIILTTACSKTSQAPISDHITVQLKWVHQAQFAGFYAAQEKNYYQDENIDVEFHPGGINIDIIEEVLSGHADIGVASSDMLIGRISEGAPIKAIAVTYRVNPFILIALPDSGIVTPKDMIGKKIAVIEGYDKAQMMTLLAINGISPDDYTMVPYEYSLDPLINGSVDVIPSFLAGTQIEVKKQIGDVNIIYPGDYGIHFYSDTIFTTNAMIENNPDLVLRFLRATLKGHQYAIAHAQEAAEISMKYAQNKDLDIQTEMAYASIPLIHTGENQIGWMNEDIWAGMIDILSEQNMLTNPVNIEDVYTMDFLYQIYGGTP